MIAYIEARLYAETNLFTREIEQAGLTISVYYKNVNKGYKKRFKRYYHKIFNYNTCDKNIVQK